MGCGLDLEIWAVTMVRPSEETSVLLDGKESSAPVSRRVIADLAPAPVRVETDLEMPLGSGFGASGAGALGCAYALNALFDLGKTSNQIGAVAHVAEVVSGTGLGDVIAQNVGGLVMRLVPGAPGVGSVDRIPVPSWRVDYVVKGPLSTKEVLSDPGTMARVNQAGEKALKDLIKKPTLDNFMNLSRRFAKDTGLAGGWRTDAIEAVEASGGVASMVMLGDAVFALNGAEALSKFGPVGSATISQGGVRLE